MRLGQIQLIDSLNFFNVSLDKAVETLRLSDYNFPVVRQAGLFPGGDECTEAEKDTLLPLLTRKAAFPYTSLRHLDQFSSMTQPPPREAFFNDLSQQPVAESEYVHCLEVFKRFKCQSMGDYLGKKKKKSMHYYCACLNHNRKLSLFPFDFCRN